MTVTRLLAACIAGATIDTMASMAALAASDDKRFEEPVQYALENLVSGTSTAALINGTEVVVVPLRTWKSVSGHYCRRYAIMISAPGAAATRDEHTRCRTGGGVWTPAKED